MGRCSFSIIGFTEQPYVQKVDVVYSLDVLEHISKEKENIFMENICKSWPDNGICIIGTLNIEASQSANPLSMEGHINLKSTDSLKDFMPEHF